MTKCLKPSFVRWGEAKAWRWREGVRDGISMIIGTFNIRGSGNMAKQKCISQIIRKISPEVMFLRETKVGKMSEQLV